MSMRSVLCKVDNERNRAMPNHQALEAPIHVVQWQMASAKRSLTSVSQGSLWKALHSCVLCIGVVSRCSEVSAERAGWEMAVLPPQSRGHPR